jgi:hypothetical protein
MAQADWVPLTPWHPHAFGARVSAGVDQENENRFAGLTLDYNHSLTDMLSFGISLSQDRSRSDDGDGGVRLDLTRTLYTSLACWVSDHVAFGAAYGKEIALSSPETDERWEWGWGDDWVSAFAAFSLWQRRHHGVGATLSVDRDLTADVTTASLDLGYTFSF